MLKNINAMIDYNQENQDNNSENIVKELEAAYEVTIETNAVTASIIEEFDVDSFYKKHKEAIDATCDRIEKTKTKAPEGYYTLKEFNELFKEKLSEAYGSL